MRCPRCSGLEDKVIQSRISRDGSSIRRRRECARCSHRYTTYEKVEENLPLVVVSCSGGARMHEGVIALQQMAPSGSLMKS